MRHEILYNSGDQTIYHVPRDRHGLASLISSATYQIIDLTKAEGATGRTVQSSTAATVSSASASLTAAAGPSTDDPRIIQVTAVGSISPGHTYLLKEDGLNETFVAKTADSGVVRTLHPLRNDYTSSAVIDGIEIEGTFPTAEAADEDDLKGGGGPYAVIWDYTIGGWEYNPLEEIWVVRYSTQALVTETDVLRAWPLTNELVRGRFSVNDAIAAASEDFLADLEASGLAPERFKHSIVTTVIVRNRALMYLHRWRNESEEADKMQEAADRLMRDLTTGQPPERTASISQVSATAEQGGETDSNEPLLRRS